MDIFNSFATDEKKEVEGAWFDVPGGNASILVARSSNPKFSKAVVKAYEKYAKSPKNNPDVEKRQEADYIKVLAEHLLLGWKEIEYKGVPLEYSRANAEVLLAIKDFRQFVQQCSDDFDAFRLQQEEEVGNS